MSAVEFERGTIETVDTIDWDDLTPECDYNNCSAAATEQTKLRHLNGGCANEGQFELLCKPHYEEDIRMVHTCRGCGGQLIAERT